MGTVADKERDPSESSGISDMMEIAASLGLEDDDVASAGVTRADDDEAEDDLDNVGAGYGGAAAAALISDASLDPEPAPAANAARASESKVARVEPPPPPPAKPSATRSPSGPVKPVETAAAASTSSAPKPARAPSGPAPVVSAPKASASVSAPVAVTASAQQPKEKKGGAIWLIGAGVLALGAIGWFIMNNNSQVKDHPVAAADVRAAASAPEESPPPPPKPEPKKVEPPPPPPVVEEPIVEEPPPPPPAEEVKAEVKVTRKKGKGDKGDAASADEKPEPSKPDPAPTQAEIDEKFRTECLLNPTKPGCDELRKKQRDAGDLDAKLIDKLSASQIRAGFGKLKGKAKACGGETGVVVHVKASISGDGDVISIDATGEHAGTPLGKCVEDALRDAKFPRSTAESQGAMYPVSF